MKHPRSRERPVERKTVLNAERLQALALNYAARYATTEAKIRHYLLRKLSMADWVGENDPALDPLIARLVDLGIVNDQAFAKMRSDGLTRRGYGANRVRLQLKRDGVKTDDAALVIADRADEALAVALAFAKRKRFGPFALTKPSLADRKKQLAAFCRAGHNYATSCHILDLKEEFVQD
jgi:regulatory protein